MNEQQNVSPRRIRFNVIDAVILLLVVLCVAGICLRYTIADSLGIGAKKSEYIVKFTISQLDSRVPAFLGAGNSLYFADSTKAGVLCGVGEFSSLSEAEAGSATLILSTAYTYVDDGQGSVVAAAYPEETVVNAEGAFKCQGAYGDDGRFCVGRGEFISVGKTVVLYTDTVTLTVTVTEILPLTE